MCTLISLALRDAVCIFCVCGQEFSQEIIILIHVSYFPGYGPVLLADAVSTWWPESPLAVHPLGLQWILSPTRSPSQSTTDLSPQAEKHGHFFLPMKMMPLETYYCCETEYFYKAISACLRKRAGERQTWITRVIKVRMPVSSVIVNVAAFFSPFFVLRECLVR